MPRDSPADASGAFPSSPRARTEMIAKLLPKPVGFFLNLFIMGRGFGKEKIAAFFSGLYPAGSDRLSKKGGKIYDQES